MFGFGGRGAITAFSPRTWGCRPPRLAPPDPGLNPILPADDQNKRKTLAEGYAAPKKAFECPPVLKLSRRCATMAAAAEWGCRHAAGTVDVGDRSVRRLQKRAIAVLLVLIHLRSGLAAQIQLSIPEPRADYPCVYVDRSHDWWFAFNDLADRMLAPAGFDVVLSDTSLTAAGPLSRFAIVVVPQFSWPTVLSANEERLLKDYVHQGGKLLVITKKGLPAERLANDFGFHLQEGRRSSWRACAPLLPHGTASAVPSRPVRCRLEPSEAQTVLIEDGDAHPIAAARDVGQGRIVVWADDGAYWDFCAQRDPLTMAVASAPTTVALFRWMLGPHPIVRDGRATRVAAEHVERVGCFQFRYSNPSAEAARQIMKHVPAVLEAVVKWNGAGPPTNTPYTIHWLPAGGGGWAEGRAAGVCVYSRDPAHPLKVLAHELTHSTTGPWPRAFNEAWASMVGMRAAAALGYPESGTAELRRILDRLDAADRTRTALDMMASDDGPMNHDYQCKATWMLMEMEKKYGDDFVSRFMSLRNRRHGLRRPITLQQTLALFAQTSGDPDLWSWFKSTGTTIRPSPSDPGPKGNRGRRKRAK